LRPEPARCAGSNYTGPVDFKINLRNELEGKNATLLSGKFKVEKFHEGVVDLPKFKNNFVYYVNYDWVLPIAYVYDEWIYNWEYAGALKSLWDNSSGHEPVALDGGFLVQRN
jgi:hypothetical protein